MSEAAAWGARVLTWLRKCFPFPTAMLLSETGKDNWPGKPRAQRIHPQDKYEEGSHRLVWTFRAGRAIVLVWCPRQALGPLWKISPRLSGLPSELNDAVHCPIHVLQTNSTVGFKAVVKVSEWAAMRFWWVVVNINLRDFKITTGTNLWASKEL